MEDSEEYTYGPDADAVINAELVARIQAGDDTALHELLPRIHGFMAAIAYSKGARPSDVDDAVQGADAKLWFDLQNNPDRKFEKPNSLRNYAGRITANHVIDNWRTPYNKHNWPVGEFLDSDGIATPSAESTVIESQTLALVKEAIEKALGDLPKGLAEALKVIYFGEETAEEYAARTGVSPNTVKTRAHRARAKLRENPALQKLFNLLTNNDE